MRDAFVKRPLIPCGCQLTQAQVQAILAHTGVPLHFFEAVVFRVQHLEEVFPLLDLIEVRDVVLACIETTLLLERGTGYVFPHFRAIIADAPPGEAHVPLLAFPFGDQRVTLVEQVIAEFEVVERITFLLVDEQETAEPT